MWCLGKNFLSSANISLLSHNFQLHFFSTMEINFFTAGGVCGGAVGERGNVFFDRVTILSHQYNNTNITYQQFYSCLR